MPDPSCLRLEAEVLSSMVPAILHDTGSIDAFVRDELHRVMHSVLVLHTPADEVQVERAFPFLEAIGFVFSAEPEAQPGALIIPDHRCPTCGQNTRRS